MFSFKYFKTFLVLSILMPFVALFMWHNGVSDFVVFMLILVYLFIGLLFVGVSANE